MHNMLHEHLVYAEYECMCGTKLEAEMEVNCEDLVFQQWKEHATVKQYFFTFTIMEKWVYNKFEGWIGGVWHWVFYSCGFEPAFTSLSIFCVVLYKCMWGNTPTFVHTWLANT